MFSSLDLKHMNRHFCFTSEYVYEFQISALFPHRDVYTFEPGLYTLFRIKQNKLAICFSNRETIASVVSLILNNVHLPRR